MAEVDVSALSLPDLHENLQGLGKQQEDLRRKPGVDEMNNIYRQCFPDYDRRPSEQRVSGHVVEAAVIKLALVLFPAPPEGDSDLVLRRKTLQAAKIPPTGIGAQGWEIYPDFTADWSDPAQILARFKEDLMKTKEFSSGRRTSLSLPSLPEVSVRIEGQWRKWETTPAISLCLEVDGKRIREKKETLWGEKLEGNVQETNARFGEFLAKEEQIKKVEREIGKKKREK